MVLLRGRFEDIATFLQRLKIASTKTLGMSGLGMFHPIDIQSNLS